MQGAFMTTLGGGLPEKMRSRVSARRRHTSALQMNSIPIVHRFFNSAQNDMTLFCLFCRFYGVGRIWPVPKWLQICYNHLAHVPEIHRRGEHDSKNPFYTFPVRADTGGA